MLQAGMGACRRSPARKQHLGLPGGAAGATDFTCIYFWHGCVAVCGVMQRLVDDYHICECNRNDLVLHR